MSSRGEGDGGGESLNTCGSELDGSEGEKNDKVLGGSGEEDSNSLGHFVNGRLTMSSRSRAGAWGGERERGGGRWRASRR